MDIAQVQAMAGELFESGVISWLDNFGGNGDGSFATDPNDADTTFSQRCGNRTNCILSRVFHGGRSLYGNVEKSRQRRSRPFAVLTYSMYAPRVKMAAALLDGLF